ncbi:MAG: IS1 family transposase [Synechococcales cyanobacterium M58_A2018_015]|nr:IS1 family transposase [Synechococcales cyanobacterium M58_A2018_015]
MECPLCGHSKTHKHGKMPNGHQRYLCPACHQTTRLVVSYFNWIWQHSRFKSTAAQRAGLTTRSWAWHDIATYPTLS